MAERHRPGWSQRQGLIPEGSLTAVGRRLRAVVGSLALLAAMLTPAAPAAAGQCDRLAGDPAACIVHDEAPPGVDVRAPVPLATLVTRPGATRAALGEQASLTRQVPCDGDGENGARVQAVYVYDATAAPGAPRGNRFEALQPHLQRWAAGVDAVYSASAARTGGVRHVRFVTEPDGNGGCRPAFLSFGLSSAAMLSPGLDAIRAELIMAGLVSPDRKYLIWADTSVICGVSSVYGQGSLGGRYSTPAQNNYNNGTVGPSFARIDSACWGMAESTEAHELTHMLGAVLDSAPHHSAAYHCTDEADLMCYDDDFAGPTSVVEVCPPEQAVLLDCNGDDYFSTHPRPGSWLSQNWNVADSRFLIGGGDGTVGGTPGTIDAIVTATPAPAGLPASARVDVATEAAGARVVSWSTRPDCVVTGSGEAVSVTCPASVAAAAVTARVAVANGPTTSASTRLVFTTDPRPASIAVWGRGGSPALVCFPATSTITARLSDTSTGVGVYGVTVYFLRDGQLVGSALTDATGTARSAVSFGAAGAIAAQVIDPRFPATPVTIPVRWGCPATAVDAALDASTVSYASPAVITGTATSVTGPAAKAVVTIDTPDGSQTLLTNPDGTFRAIWAATSSGPVTVTVDGVAATLPLTVTDWTAHLDAVVDQDGVLVGLATRTDHEGRLAAVADTELRVGVDGLVRTVHTDAAGRFSLALAPSATTWNVQLAAAPGRGAAQIAGERQAGASTIELDPVAPGSAGPVVTVSGRVAEAPAGTPVAVSVRTSAGATLTTSAAPDGGFTVELPATESMTVTAAYQTPTGEHRSAPVLVQVPQYVAALTWQSLPTPRLGSPAQVEGRLRLLAVDGSPVSVAVPVHLTYTMLGHRPGGVTVTADATGSFDATIPGFYVACTLVASTPGLQAPVASEPVWITYW